MTTQISMFDQIKTEPLQFYPQSFTSSHQPGTVILQAANASVLGNKHSDVRFIFIKSFLKQFSLFFCFLVY